jgi:hypothetical protein
VINIFQISILLLVSPYLLVGFEVLISVVIKSSIFLDMTPCSPLKVNRRFWWTWRFHLQGRRISSGSACHLLSRWFLDRVILQSWRCRRYVPPKRHLAFNELHGIISQKTEFSIFTWLTLFKIACFPYSYWSWGYRNGSIVRWSTLLQAGRSRFRFPMRSLDISINLILPVALWPWGRLGL